MFFDLLFKLVKELAARLLLLLQSSAICRKLLRRFFRPDIRYLFQQNRRLSKAKEPGSKSPESYEFSAWYDGRKVGSVWLVKKEKDSRFDWWVYSLGVSYIRFRGLGIGMQLMNCLIDFAKEKGAEKLYLTVNPKKIPAIKCYKKLGFLEDRTDSSGKLILMEKALQGGYKSS